VTEQHRPLVRGARSPYETAPEQRGPSDLADILERVLDKGIVIAGDIKVNLLDIELLTIKIRLLVASVDRAKEMGIDWWEHDPLLTTRREDRNPDRELDRREERGEDRELERENRELRERIEALEARAKEES
jgi:hypothetical protein